MSTSSRTPLHSRFLPFLAAAAVVSGCNVDHSMEPQPAGPVCPSQGAALGEADSAIAWYGPTEARDKRKLSEWCGTVGPSLIDSLPAPQYGAWTPEDSLAIVTWNVNVGGGDLELFLQEELNLDCDGGRPLRRQGFSHFVLLLQEARRLSGAIPVVRDDRSVPPRIEPDPWPGEHRDVADIARDCGLALFYVPSMRNGVVETDGKREDRGNALLSSLPLSDFIALELPFEGSRKVAVAATVLSQTGDSLRLVNLHLSVSSTFYRTLMSGNSTRLRQAQGMTEALSIIEAQRSPQRVPSIATVAGGDTNTWSDDETALQRLRIDFPDSPPSDGVTTRDPFPTDHVFFRQGAAQSIELIEGSYRTTERDYGSDHLARTVRLVIENRRLGEGDRK